MFRATSASRTLRFYIFGLVTIIAAVLFTNNAANARRHHHHHRGHHHREDSRYSPPFSSIIVDGNSGSVLQANSPDSPRHPASLTKIMTLYLLFERIEGGKLSLNTEMNVSEHASEQAPTKLGLRPNQTIRVEDAIKGLITRSANDAAVVISEAIAGDEENFAKLMTRKAHMLGMTHTIYKNASGLPDDAQITTARDQATLGRAIQDRFPRYYRYFAINDFHYRGSVIRNHNKLLGRIEGVDGIKTGYTRASGFNLVTSMRRGNRHLIGVVMGGRSGSSRDAIMHNLLAENLNRAATNRTVAAITERSPAEYKIAGGYTNADEATESKTNAKPVHAIAAPVAPQTPIIPAKSEPASFTSGVISQQVPIIPSSGEPMTPVRVKTMQIKAGQTRVASAAPPQEIPVSTTSIPQTRSPEVANESKPVTHSGWIIQVGALETESEAKHRLDAARGSARDLLGKADPFTEAVTKDGKSLYRARFAGLDKDSAEAACRALKRNDISCIAIKN